MNKEEKEAIELLKKDSTDYYYRSIDVSNSVKVALNYIDKLQKELQREKNRIMELAEMLDKKDEEIKRLETELELERNM